MAISEIPCGDGTMPVVVGNPATVHDGRPALVVSFGLTNTGIGGPQAKVLSEFAERMAMLTGMEVYAFNPHGVGESGGELSYDGLVADVRLAVDSVPSATCILVGFGAVFAGMVAAAVASSRVVGLVGIDLNELIDSELLRTHLEEFGTRLEAGETLGRFGIEAQRQLPNCPALLVERAETPQAVYREFSSALQAEVHRVVAMSERMQYDPRTYAILLGWLERTTWLAASGPGQASP